MSEMIITCRGQIMLTPRTILAFHRLSRLSIFMYRRFTQSNWWSIVFRSNRKIL